MVRLSGENMGRAVALSEEGQTQRKIAEILGTSAFVINRLLARYRARGTARYRHGGGHPLATTRREDQAIVRVARRQPRLSAAAIGVLTVPRPVSRHTIAKRLKEAGLRCCRLATKPFLLPRHRAVRREFGVLDSADVEQVSHN